MEIIQARYFRILFVLIYIFLQYLTSTVSETCSLGNTIKYRGSFFRDGYVVVFPSKRLPCSGNVTHWKYWTEEPGRFRAFIVRPTRFSSRFRMVGINDIHVTLESANKTAIFEIPLSNRFEVRSGDMIAVGIPNDNIQNPFLQTERMQGEENRYTYMDPFDLSTAEYIQTTGSSNSTQVSISVTIETVKATMIINVLQSLEVNTDPNSATATVWWTPPTAGDNVGELLTLTSDYSPGDKFKIGETTVTYIAKDLNGNTAFSTFDVVVVDDERPSILNTPPSQYVTVESESGTATIFWTPPTTSDNSGESVTLTSNYNPGDRLPIGTTTITYKAIDAHGNLATASFNVNVSVRKRYSTIWMIVVGSAVVVIFINLMITTYVICRRKKTQTKDTDDTVKKVQSADTKVPPEDSYQQLIGFTDAHRSDETVKNIQSAETKVPPEDSYQELIASTDVQQSEYTALKEVPLYINDLYTK